ncbi:hypothetical protein FRC12_004290 [Ceratobasidium sp. 428]|nr:hypothetical protein FRC12_004290 [Ceratobasidium sp. 428]
MTSDCAQTHLMFQRTTLEVVLVPLSATYWPTTSSYQTNRKYFSLGLSSSYDRPLSEPVDSTSPDLGFTLSCSHSYSRHRSLCFAPVLIRSLTPTPTALVSTCAPLAYNPTVGPWSARILRWVHIPGCLRDQRNPDRRLGLDKTSHQFPTIQHVPGSTSTDAGRPSVRPVGLVFGFGCAVGHLVGAERQSERNDQ